MFLSHGIRHTVDALEDRLTPAGDLDPTFGTAGRALVPSQSAAAAAAALPDGSILVAGWAEVDSVRRFAVAKLRPDGTADAAFGTNGLATVAFPPALVPGIPDPFRDGRATAVAVQPDGRIVLVGAAPGQGIGLARLTAAGRPDTSFGTNGSHVLFAGETAYANAVAVQADGRIVIAGGLVAGANTDFLAVRLTPTGAFDPGFGGDGQVTIPFDLGGATADVASALAVQPDGRILLAGTAALAPGSSSESQDSDLAVVRLTPDGAADPTFDADGRWTLGLARTDSAGAVAVRPDGRILVGGTTGSATFLHGIGGASFDYVVVQLRPDGTTDTTFGDAGRSTIPIPDPSPALVGSENALTGLAVQSTGQVVVAGHGYTRYAARLTDAGRLDGTFGTGGLSGHSPGGPGAEDVLVTPLGHVLLAGTATDVAAGTQSMAVLRLQGDPIGPGTIQVGGRADGTGTVLTPTAGAFATVGMLSHFPGTGEVRTAVADVTGDGVPDFIGGAGPGGGPQFVVTDGRTGGRVAGTEVFEASFTGGVYVAAADLDGDGKAEVIVTPDRGGGPVVAIYSGAKLAAGLTGDAAQLVRFFGIDDPAFRGGARPAVGDIDGDGRADLAVSAGFLGGPRIALFNGAQVIGRVGEINAAGGRPADSFRLVPDFFAFEDTLRNGAFVSVGDVTGDAKADVAFGGGPGGAPRVRLFDGARLLAAGAFKNLDDITAAQAANFFAGGTAPRGGVRVALRDVTGDGRADLVAGSGEGEPSRVRVFLATTLPTIAVPTPVPDQELDPFGVTLPNGVFVG